MKTLIATVAALATVATLSAAPAMAENTASEQQHKLQKIIAMQKGTYHSGKQTSVSKSRKTERAISTRMLTGPEKALARLLRVQPDAAKGER